MITDHRNYDGVHRSSISMALIQGAPREHYEHDTALRGYYDTPRPDNDNVRVYRSVRSSQPRHCYNSTSFKYVEVSLPRITMLDGAYAPKVPLADTPVADNDNREAAHVH